MFLDDYKEERIKKTYGFVYIIRRQTHDSEKTYDVMNNIFKLVSILPVSEEDIQVG